MGSIIFLSVIVSHVILRLYAKAHAARQKPRGDVHKPELLNRMVFSYLGICLFAFAEYSTGRWGSSGAFQWIGVCTYAIASYLQWKAFQDLGAAYSPDIETRQTQVLVQTGLYRWVRHPLLSSLLLEILGVLLFFQAYMTGIVVLCVFVPILEQRRREEERVLEKHFGQSYRAYQTQVGALWPKLGGFIHGTR